MSVIDWKSLTAVMSGLESYVHWLRENKNLIDLSGTYFLISSIELHCDRNSLGTNVHWGGGGLRHCSQHNWQLTVIPKVIMTFFKQVLVFETPH